MMRLQESQLDRPIYPAAEAGRLVGLSSVRVRRWLKGYSYKHEEITHKLPPLINRQGTLDTSYVSFLELIDLLFAKRFIDYGISLQKVRIAFNEASQILNTNHFARQCFFTIGKDIFLQFKDQGDALLQLLSDGQWVIAPIIEQLSHQINFDSSTEIARRWFPNGYNGLIVLDPFVSFGRPSIFGKGIATSNVYDFFNAENKSYKHLCSWMNISKKEAIAAINFEEQLAA